jgi:pimeloyl-ACP methyl ester carboxylesterase
MRACTALIACLLLAAHAAPQGAPQSVPLAAPPALQREFAVPMHDGQVQLADLVRALCTAYELDAGGLRLPDLRIDLRGARGWAWLAASRRLLLDTVRCRRDFERGELLVAIDRDRARDVRRDLRARLAKLAGGLAGEDATGRRYELALPAQLDPGKPLCVLVHGVESDASVWTDLKDWLTAPGRSVQVATFAYPNDEAVERVAAELASRLRALGAQPVVLVGHSMGGLVARDVVEDPALDPGNVRVLVMTGTPNEGSNLAGFLFALELADVLREMGGDAGAHADVGPFARALVLAAIDHFRDGLGEAGGDLLPGSVCLAHLAARSRNPRVQYHLVLGTRSLLTQEQLAAVQAAVRARLADRGLPQVVKPRLERWLADLDELVDGRGDGAVSVARGRLAGVEPVLVPLYHVGLVRLRGLLGGTEKQSSEREKESRVQPAFGVLNSGDAQPVFARIAEWVAAAR